MFHNNKYSFDKVMITFGIAVFWHFQTFTDTTENYIHIYINGLHVCIVDTMDSLPHPDQSQKNTLVSERATWIRTVYR